MPLQLRPELEDEDERYVTGGAPPQPFRVLLPPKHELPIIRTERLCLRPLKREDADPLFRSKSTNPPSTKFFTPWQSMDDVYAWMDRKTFTRPPAAVGLMFQYVIFVGQEPVGEPIGSLGFNQVHPTPNIGYGIGLDYQGKGYVSEALGGLLRTWWSFPRREKNDEEDEAYRKEGWDGVERVFACAHHQNIASIRVLEKNGLQVYLRKTMADGEIVCCAAMERPAE